MNLPETITFNGSNYVLTKRDARRHSKDCACCGGFVGRGDVYASGRSVILVACVTSGYMHRDRAAAQDCETCAICRKPLPRSVLAVGHGAQRVCGDACIRAANVAAGC